MPPYKESCINASKVEGADITKRIEMPLMNRYIPPKVCSDVKFLPSLMDNNEFQIWRLT